jgi:hypothetical protein
MTHMNASVRASELGKKKFCVRTDQSNLSAIVISKRPGLAELVFTIDVTTWRPPS